VLASALLPAGPAWPQADGRIGMLMIGRYDCETPGNAGSDLRHPDEAASFSIISSSRYIAADGSIGTYLRTGAIVTMTSGPLAGTRLVIVRPAFLRRLEPSGEPGRLRCVLSRATDAS
jgi:hypothetical protein